MNIGLCYERVEPARGGCEHYISDLARRLARDGHGVHLFASEWDESALPSSTVYHRLPAPHGPRTLRPWRFAKACVEALARHPVDVSMGFDKTYGQDVLYPQGGLHSASRVQNIRKHPPGLLRLGARLVRAFDVASYSYSRLERRQYLTPPRPLIVVNSRMVQGHFRDHLGIPESDVRVLYSAIDPDRFAADDRDARRQRERAGWRVGPDETVGLLVAMNYRLKGLAPLLRSLPHVPPDRRFRIAIVGSRNYSAYEALAGRLGVRDRVVFLGFRAEPRDAYFAADFLVHPTFYDPCSLVALEALACGLPVVTSQYNGASELLSPPADGLVVQDPHDARELGGAIAEMLDPAKLTARKAAAREARSRWTFEDHYRSLLAILEEAARRRAPAERLAASG
ncbi:MAG TPA: glycosyltransferase family 4 protein [Gemmataceae bacterium]|nr:glycosyltransferase family 4 protein [Gemmataceae bacterium]